MTEKIGGYFEWEQTQEVSKGPYHVAPDFVNARSGFYWLLKMMNADRVWMPFFICDSMISSAIHAGAKVEWYDVDRDLRPILSGDIRDSDAVLIVRYFGMDHESIQGPRVIVDATQDFYYRPTSLDEHCIISVRKWFGVPDGCYVYSHYQDDLSRRITEDAKTMHLQLRAEGKTSEGFVYYQQHESEMSISSRRMSAIASEVLSRVDYQKVRSTREGNMRVYRELLESKNMLCVPEIAGAPFCYPFLPSRRLERQRLFDQGIFVGQYWPDVVSRRCDGNYRATRSFSARMLALPVDQRYTPSDCEHVAAQILRMVS